MSGFRLPQGGRVDRSRPVSFSFDGKAYQGLAGDTLASALLANGVMLLGRSFKYHRPRGLLGAGSEEPNAQIGGKPPRPARDRYQRIGLFAARPQHPARAVVFERAAQQHHAIREQRRGQCIPGIAPMDRPIEAEADRAATIDPPALGHPEAAHRRGSPAL